MASVEDQFPNFGSMPKAKPSWFQFSPALRRILAWVLACCSGSLFPAVAQTVTPLPTAETVLLGRFAQGPLNLPLWVERPEFQTTFGSANVSVWPAEVQARQFFENGGTALYVIRIAETGSLFRALTGDANAQTGLYAVEPLSDVRLLVVPELSRLGAEEFAAAYASYRAFLKARGVFCILDPPPGLDTAAAMIGWAGASLPDNAAGCAIYYPYLQIQLDDSDLTVPASGAMAAIYEQNDAAFGVWHSPAGTAFPFNAITTSPVLNSLESDSLNTLNINSIRSFPGSGIVPWGARTLDLQNLENRYVPVVRTRDWIAACLHRSLAFAATNDDSSPLWSQIRTMTEDFLQSLFVQGAFAGATPSQAYFVRCDSTTTTASDIALHRVNVIYGIALFQPSEFLITSLSASTYDALREAPRPILRALSTQGILQFAYPTEPGFDYVMEATPDPASGHWTPAEDSLFGDGAWRRTPVATTENRAFFRLRITPAR